MNAENKKDINKVRVGLISFEHMHAASYAKYLCENPNVMMTGVFDTDSCRGSEQAIKLHTRFYERAEDLLADSDAVVICTCNKLHSQYTIQAARAGKHVLVEKPITVSISEAQSMIETCRENSVNLMTAFPLRFNKSIIEAREAVLNNEIGDILCITGINHGKIPSGWFLDKDLAGGGCVIDHTVHVSDLMRWILQSEVKTVYAEAGEMLHHKGIDDCGMLSVTFENGVFATIDTSWAHHINYPVWPDIYLKIVGTDGVITVDAFKQTESLYNRNGHQDFGFTKSSDKGLVDEFINSVIEHRAPLITGVDGMQSLKVALAAYESSVSHIPVEIV